MIWKQSFKDLVWFQLVLKFWNRAPAEQFNVNFHFTV
jgi:hypothetical protein